MRTYEEYHKILTLWDSGLYNKSKIARLTGIPRGAVKDCIKKYGSVAGLEEYRIQKVEIAGESGLVNLLKDEADPENIHEAYAYILGIYLGDGAISQMNRVHRIRIALDTKYPKIIELCMNALEKLLPDNQVSIVDRETWKVVSCYYKHWPAVFPQDGDGKKHERPILLEDWQQAIVDKYPLEFFRGLYHSDGSRSRNVVNGKDYPRYMFSNYSDDIRRLFTDTAEKLGLTWTTANARNVAISKRKDVAWLDENIGAKA